MLIIYILFEWEYDENHTMCPCALFNLLIAPLGYNNIISEEKNLGVKEKSIWRMNCLLKKKPNRSIP